MQTIYELALEEIGTDEVEIQALLDQWRNETAHGIRIVDNIRNDYNIPVPVMKAILQELHKHKGLPIIEIEAKIYLKKCYDSGLQGSLIEMAALPQLLGCAKPVNNFAASIKERFKTLSDEQIDELIGKLYSKTEMLTSVEEDIPLSNYPCWSTWGINENDSPFYFLTAQPRVIEVLANLGLSHSQLKMDHLLFTYSKDVIEEVRIPTVADAALYSYFKCTGPRQACGWTQPWNPEECKEHKLTYDQVKPRSEGVHICVTLKDLKRPVQLIKHD